MNGLKGLQIRTVETRVVSVTREQLQAFSLKELRYYAASIGVPSGKTKDDVITNLLESGKATILAQLGN